MKKFIETIRNIFRIEDLRKRIVYTFGILLIYRLGSFVVLPGIDPSVLSSASEGQGQEGILGLLDIFSGGAFSNASIFALGIMPYITASIVIQLLGMALPYFRKLQMEGESGRRKINQWTRFLTIGILLFQAPAYLLNIPTLIGPGAIVLDNTWLFTLTGTTILIAGTMFCMWLGEKITDKGIGNGISLIIMVGIIARLPHAFIAELTSRFSTAGGGFVMLLIEIVLLFLVFAATIALVQAVRKIPVQYAKRVVGNRQYGGVRQYIPLKINSAGVMPIIFAQAIMMLPALFGQFESTQGLAVAFGNIYGLTYNVTFFILIVLFTYFYTAITINTNQMADDMKRNGGFIPGIKPGKLTGKYLDQVMTRITLPGSVFLGVVAVLPVFAHLIGIEPSFAMFYGGTSLLILVGVVLDTLQQIESQLLLRHYDGMIKGGKLKGRNAV